VSRNDGKVRLRIVSFNDFHGCYRETDGTIGAAKFVTALQDYANSYSRDYPTSVCVMCAGDSSTGTALSYYAMRDASTGKAKNDNPLYRLFSLTHVTCACLGNHEYDWGSVFLEDHVAHSSVSINGKEYKAYSSSNIVNNETGTSPGGIPSYDLITLQNYDFTVAVITLTTMETVTKSLPGSTDGYTFEKPSDCAKRYVEALKDNVDGFIFLTHMSSYSDINGDVILKEEADDILDMVALKPLAIITAHSHKPVAGTIDGVPIIQAWCHANALASVDLLFDPITKTTTVESLEYVDLLAKRDTLAVNSEMQKAIDYAASMCNFENIGVNLKELQRDRNTFTPLGALVAKALSTSFKEITGDEPVLCFQHSGGIRIDFPKGEITEEQCYNLLPFDSHMSLCKLPGENILRLVREGMTNSNGFLQSYGLRLYYNDPTDPRENFRFATFHHDGKDFVIQPDVEYWVAVDYFVASGGDGFGKEIFTDHIIVRDGPIPRDAFARFLKDDLKGNIVLKNTDMVTTAILAKPQVRSKYSRPKKEKTESTDPMRL